MDQIQHKYVEANGLNHHVAEVGTGQSVVVFLHGFPEIWYSWRHQMIAVANAGYRAIAPDWRGYGLSDPPPEPEKASFGDLINDLLGILDALSIPKVFIVGKDFGAWPAYYFALLYPERVLGVATLGIPFVPPGPVTYNKYLPEGFYISRWKEPGRAEADFGRLDAKTVVRNVYILFSKTEIPIAREDQEIMDMVESSTPLPPWFTEEDLEAYGALYQKAGFRTALKVPYRGRNTVTREIIEHTPISLLPNTAREDSIIWNLNANGRFSIQSAWNAFRRPKPLVPWAKVVWYKHAIHRWAIVQWLAILCRLSTKDRLQQWGVLVENQCVLCSNAVESHEHLFFQCPFSSQLWSLLQMKFSSFCSLSVLSQVVDWMVQHHTGTLFLNLVAKVVFGTTIYHVWGERNRRIFQQHRALDVRGLEAQICTVSIPGEE